MKLTGHGCSFIYGSELSSPALSWPALISHKLGYDYHCCAVPGAGNLQIMESVMLHAANSDLCIINWTWIDRFDFVSPRDESWQTLRPAMDHEHADYYYRNLHGQYRDMLTNLNYINSALEFLRTLQIPFVMTYMDDLLFDIVRPDWHQPDAVVYLQAHIRPYMHDFEGSNFLEWSRNKKFPISAAWHPLETAHAAAAQYMLPVIDDMQHKD